MLFLSVDPLTLLTNFVVNVFAVFADNWLWWWIHCGEMDVRVTRAKPPGPGFNEPLDVRYGSQKEIFLGLLGGRLIVSRACCGTTRSDP
ncbi:hypothetical protein SAMN03159474_04211 [Pseudomonas sp. NFACC08-1]|nr:hypothetical protein SAMN03159474_04211 [Pseudomonas sp. NFACC08-1]